MPDHIHIIVVLDPDKYVKQQDGSSKAPTPTNEMLPHIVSTFKRFCNKEIGSNIYQRGYIEHITCDREDYDTSTKYICEKGLLQIFICTVPFAVLINMSRYPFSDHSYPVLRNRTIEITVEMMLPTSQMIPPIENTMILCASQQGEEIKSCT